jgi:hypothetical protein
MSQCQNPNQLYRNRNTRNHAYLHDDDTEQMSAEELHEADATEQTRNNPAQASCEHHLCWIVNVTFSHITYTMKAEEILLWALSEPHNGIHLGPKWTPHYAHTLGPIMAQ